MDRIEIYTDGACSGNPGIGGWGVLLRVKSIETELFGGEPATTNNRMHASDCTQKVIRFQSVAGKDDVKFL